MAKPEEILAYEVEREREFLSDNLGGLIDKLTHIKTRLDKNGNSLDLDEFLARDLSELIRRASRYNALRYALMQLPKGE